MIMAVHQRHTLNKNLPKNIHALRAPNKNKQPLFIISNDNSTSLHLLNDYETICCTPQEFEEMPEKRLSAIMRACQAILIQWPLPKMKLHIEAIHHTNSFGKPMIAICEPSETTYASAVSAGFSAVVNGSFPTKAVDNVIDVSNKLVSHHDVDDKTLDREPVASATFIEPSFSQRHHSRFWCTHDQ